MKGKNVFKVLNPFQELIEARRELKKLSHENERLDLELKEIREKKKRVMSPKN